MNEKTKMRTQTQAISNFHKVVPAQHMNLEVHAEAQNRFSPRVLEISSLLHTTLELDKLVDLFVELTHTDIAYDGLTYRAESQNVQASVGQEATHQCNYQMVIAHDKLGQITFFRNYPFSDNELTVLENLLCALIYPLRNSLLYHQAVQSSLIDPLTGAKNRKGMENAINREIDLARRHNAALSIIVLDIDHFKTVNDRFGHAAGDTALQAVAQCIGKTIRGSDMLFRYGGEEFVILLSSTNKEGAQLLAERIRENIEALVFTEPSALTLTASLGVSSLQSKDDSQTLFQRADSALYKAKNCGRNEVIIG